MRAISIVNIRLMPVPGSHLDEVKQQASELAKQLKTRATFNHNGQEYVCDDEGNCAKTTRVSTETNELGYPM